MNKIIISFKQIIYLLKLCVTISILLWLYNNGKMNFSIIPQLFQRKTELVFCIVAGITAVLINSVRWRLLINTSSNHQISLKDAVNINFIQIFISNIIPGIVGTDITKVYYGKRANNNMSITFLLTSSLIDRFFGFFGLIFLIIVSSIPYYLTHNVTSSEVTNLMYINILAITIALSFLALLLLPKQTRLFLSKAVLKISFVSNELTTIFSNIDAKTTIICILLGVTGQFIEVAIFITMVIPFLDNAISLSELMLLIPTGIIANAFPITPLKLGTGNLIFGYLFGIFGISNGTSLFNLYIVVTIATSLFGIYPFMTFRKK